jgi:beta-N-acetylhexosaminidase
MSERAASPPELPIEQAVGQLVFSFVGDRLGLIEEMLQAGQIGAVILSRGDMVTPEQTAHLSNHLQKLSPEPLLTGADFEAGVGQQVQEGATELPTLMAIGATRSQAIARTCGEITGREARAIGVHLPLAPVLDVNSNPANPIIGYRSFGQEASLVAELGVAFCQGVADAGALACGKHFPGHGDTATDSHLALPTVTRTRADFEETDLRPYRACIAGGLPAVMTAHIVVPALDPTPGLPATLSYLMLTDLLRLQFGFEGLIITDAMGMRAIADGFAAGDAAIQAVQAGADLVLTPDPRETYRALLGAVRTGELAAERVQQSAARLRQAKRRVGLYDERLVDPSAAGSAVGTEEHTARALEAAEAAVTIVRNEGALPLAGPAWSAPAVVSCSEPHGASAAAAAVLRREVGSRHPQARFVELPSEPTVEQQRFVAQAVAEAQCVVVAVFPLIGSLQPHSGEPADAHLRLTHDAQAARKRVVVVSFGSPYVVRHFPTVAGYVCAYGATRPLVEAAVAALFGEIVPAGRLPVELPGVGEVGWGLTYGSG